MSKDLVRLLKLQDIGKSAPTPNQEGIDESFGVIREELDALSSKVKVASQHRDELERKVALQVDELSSLRQALKESDATCLKLEDEVGSLQAQLNRGFDPTEESEIDSEQEQSRDMLVEAAHPIFDDFKPSAETGFHENLDSENVPPAWKQEGTDWLAVFNPHVKRTLNITLVKTFTYNSPVKCVRLSPDMKYLAAACGISVHIYDAGTGVKIRTFETNKMVSAICFSPNSSMLAVGSHDEEFDVLTTATWEIRYTFGRNTAGIASLCFSQDGGLLVAGTYSNNARIWSLKDGSCKTVSAGSGSLYSISLFPNGLLALGCGNGSIEIWNPKKTNPDLVGVVPGHESAVRSLAFVPHTAKGLLTASEDKSLKYWDASPLLGNKKALAKHKIAVGNGLLIQCKLKFTGHQECVTSFAISHDSQLVVSGSKDHCVQFWDLKTATSLCILKGHSDFITFIDLSRTGNTLVTGSKDGKVRMWTYI